MNPEQMINPVPRTFNEFARGIRPSVVFSTDLPNGKSVAWARRHQSENAARNIAFADSKCNTCAKNAELCVRYSGPQGSLFLAEVIPYGSCTDMLIACSKTTCANPGYDLVLVTPKTFPPLKYTGEGKKKMEEFLHWTIVPNQVTDPSMVERMTNLWSKTTSSVMTRLEKFLCPGARSTMILLDNILKSRRLMRPDYWTATCDWVLGFQVKFSTDFDQMTQEQKEELCVYAMATGYAIGDVHYNFQTSSNLLDFMVMESEDAVSAEMDKRSDPRTNQVSQVAHARALHGVTKKWNVALWWDGVRYKDDLDLRVSTKYGTVYFGKTVVSNMRGEEYARLDFDAGISGREDKPVENVSFSNPEGEVTIHIDNFTHRTRGDVPCSIVISQQGCEDITHNVVWTKDRIKGDYLFVCTHRFTEIKETKVEMSDTQARAVASQDKEFQSLFGTPTSTVGTTDDLIVLGVPVFILADEKVSNPSHNSACAMSEFNGLVNAALQPKTETKNVKKFLSERVSERQPTTLDELWERRTPSMNIQIHPPDHVPGYITKVEVASVDALMCNSKTTLSACHFQDKFQHPLKPVKPGNARLDESWFHSSFDDKVTVSSLVKVEGKYFLVLNGARLSTNTTTFPLSSGFYPQDLSGVGHKHRSKWAFLNTALKPQMSTQGSMPLIGTFLTGETATLFVNGQKLVLKVQEIMK